MRKVVTEGSGCGENFGQLLAPYVLHRDMGDTL